MGKPTAMAGRNVRSGSFLQHVPLHHTSSSRCAGDGTCPRPHGRIVITDWCDDYLACRLCTAYLRLTSKAHYKTYRQAECVALLKAAGHAQPNVERYKINWMWGLMTATAVKPTL